MSIEEKVSKYLSSSDVKLFSQIPISDEEYGFLLRYTRNYSRSMYMASTAPANPLVALTLVQIAIRAYAEGNYWDYFLSEMQMDISASKRNYLGQVFVSTIRKYHLFELDHADRTKYAYVENIKAHTFVPNNYLLGYFDFLFAFYDRNLLRQLSDDIKEDIEELSDFFYSTLRYSGDSFSLTTLDNKPAKSYKLLKATRTLLAEGDSVLLSKEIYRHLKIIDDYYYDDVLPDRNERFGKAFYTWQDRNAKTTGRERIGARRRSAAFYHKPYFRIDRRTATAEMVIPEQKIRNDDFDGTVTAIVSVGGDCQTYKLDLYRAFGVIVSEPLRVKVNNIFDEFEVIIQSKVEKKFEIPSRDYRIFDSESDELLKLRLGQNYLITKKGSIVRGKKPVYKNSDWDNWDEYSFADVDDKTVIYINNTPISTAGAFAEGIDFAYVSKEYYLQYNNHNIQTAYRHPVISFRVNRQLYDGAFIWCNEEKFRIDDIAASVIELPEDPQHYGITIQLEDILADSPKLYSVSLDEPAKQRHEICRYVYLPALRCYPEKLRFIFASEALITIAGKYNVEPLNACRMEATQDTYIVDLADGVDKGVFSLTLENCTYTLVVPLQIFKFGFEGNWQVNKPDYIWAEDLKNDLSISMPGATQARVYVASRQSGISIDGIHLGNGLFRFDISELVEYVKNSPKAYTYISLQYTDNKERYLPLFRVLNCLYVDKANVVFDDKKVRLDVHYEGKNGLVVRFCEEVSGNLVVERPVKNGMNDFPELSLKGLYTMYMFESISDPFGFTNELYDMERTKHNIGAVDYNDLTNCKIRITKVACGGDDLPLEYSYEVYNLEKKDDATYIGTLFEKKNDGPRKGSNLSGKQPIAPHIIVDPLIMEFIVEDGEPCIASIQYEYDEGAYDPLYYDTKQKELVRSDLISGDYNRFVPLYEDSTCYSIRIWRAK